MQGVQSKKGLSEKLSEEDSEDQLQTWKGTAQEDGRELYI